MRIDTTQSHLLICWNSKSPYVFRNVFYVFQSLLYIAEPKPNLLVITLHLDNHPYGLIREGQ